MSNAIANSRFAPFIERIGLPPALFLGFVGLLFFMIGDGVESGYISPFLAENGAGSAHRAAMIISVYGLSVTLGSWLSGALSETWGPRRVMWIGLGIWAVFEILFLSVALTTHSYVLMLVCYGIRGWVIRCSPTGSSSGCWRRVPPGGWDRPSAGSTSPSPAVCRRSVRCWPAGGYRSSANTPRSGCLSASWSPAVCASPRAARGGRRHPLGPGGDHDPAKPGRQHCDRLQEPADGSRLYHPNHQHRTTIRFFVFFLTVFAVQLGFGTSGWLNLVFLIGGVEHVREPVLRYLSGQAGLAPDTPVVRLLRLRDHDRLPSTSCRSRFRTTRWRSVRRALRHHARRIHADLGADVADGSGEEGQCDRGVQPRRRRRHVRRTPHRRDLPRRPRPGWR